MSQQSITVRASNDFWAHFSDRSPPDRRKLLSEMLVAWDGSTRQFPHAWRGHQQELSLPVTQELSGILEAIKAKDIARTTALFSAAVQFGLPSPKAKQEVDSGPSAESPVKTPKAHRPHPPRKPLSKPATWIHDLALNGLGAKKDAALILIEKLRAHRSEAIQILRRNKVYVFDVRPSGETKDEADQSNSGVTLREQNEALARARRYLVDADLALQRMRDGKYGWCEETGDPIGFERLLDHPFARLSVAAQERLESRLRLMGLA